MKGIPESVNTKTQQAERRQEEGSNTKKATPLRAWWPYQITVYPEQLLSTVLFLIQIFKCGRVHQQGFSNVLHHLVLTIEALAYLAANPVDLVLILATLLIDMGEMSPVLKCVQLLHLAFRVLIF